MSGDPWSLSVEDFPARCARADQLAFCLRYAVLAPSSHNSQPWRFEVHDDAVDVFADRRRRLPVVDPEDRELTISCGAALETLVIAMARFGIRHRVAVAPSATTPDLLARVVVAGDAVPTSAAWFDAIVLRRTRRVAFADLPVDPRTVEALTDEAAARGIWLHATVAPEERIGLGDLVAEGDRIQMSDRAFRRELASWLRTNRGAARDGMPGYAVGLGDAASMLGPFVVRTFDTGASRAAKSRALALRTPLLVTLGTDEDGPRSWLAVGRALTRILLRATAAGMSASFLNQPIEVPSLRARLAARIGRSGAPQILVRLGVAPTARPTPRRALDDVMTLLPQTYATDDLRAR